MTITNGYTTLATAKVRIGNIPDTADDTTLESIITAVSRWIDAECGRFFFTATQTRYYTAYHAVELWIDDALTITSLNSDYDGDGVYETTWAASDYYLLPANARNDSPVQPYSHIRMSLNGHYSFPQMIPNGVQIVGSWGYDTAVPSVIAEACLLQTARIFRRKDAPFGVTGSADMGQSMVLPRLDPDVRMMLAPYRRLHVG